MKPVHLLLFAGFTALAACPNPKPETAVAPQPNADSLAAIRQAHDDSIRAAEEAARLAMQRRSDSLAAAQRSAELRQTLVTPIHFDFDRATIRPSDASILDQKVPILSSNAALRVKVAGNCDERGSDEYNLALGNRRAMAAKQYLITHGVDAGRIETISYGEERPVNPDHTEEAWAQNRNDQFTLLTGDVVLQGP